MAQWNLHASLAPSRQNDSTMVTRHSKIRVAACDGTKSVVLLFPFCVAMALRAIDTNIKTMWRRFINGNVLCLHRNVQERYNMRLDAWIFFSQIGRIFLVHIRLFRLIPFESFACNNTWRLHQFCRIYFIQFFLDTVAFLSFFSLRCTRNYFLIFALFPAIKSSRSHSLQEFNVIDEHNDAIHVTSSKVLRERYLVSLNLTTGLSANNDFTRYVSSI